MPFRDDIAADFAAGRVTDLGGDVIVINEAGPFAPSFVRRGQGTRGKQRTSIEIVSEPLLFDLDEMALGAKPAAAIRAALERAVKSITAIASPETLERRKRAAQAISGALSDAQIARRRGREPYRGSYDKHYSGGRTGLKPPNQTPRLFNDSERLAEGFAVRENKSDTTWTVNVPANRLAPEEFRGGAFDRMLERLRSLVPMLQDARALLADSSFNAAVSEAVRDMVTKGEMNGDAAHVMKLKQLAAARKQAARALLGLAKAVLGA